jgi:hypothetical protein
MTEKLEWGLVHAVPEHAPVAWGARSIISDTMPFFDLLPDRQHMVGSEALRAALGRAMNQLGSHDGYLARAQAAYDKLRQEGAVRPSSQGLVKLVDDKGHLCIHADARSSYGYLYVAAWFDAEDIDTSEALCWGDENYDNDDVEALRWSHREPPPEIGSDLTCALANKGSRATVVGYINCHGYLGALVVPYEPFCNPDRLPVVCIFGCDIVDKSEDNDGTDLPS